MTTHRGQHRTAKAKAQTTHPKPHMAARIGALVLLDNVLRQKRFLSDRVLQGSAAADKARALRLARHVLKRMHNLDALLAQYMRKPLPLPIINILRLSLVDMFASANTEQHAHGIVSDAVDLTRATQLHLTGANKLAPVVNAILRHIVRDQHCRAVPLWTMPCPLWLRTPLVHAYGNDAVLAIERAHARTDVPVDLTLKQGGNAHALCADTAWAQVGAQVIATGGIRVWHSHISTLPSYQSGAWWVQDAAAAIAVRGLSTVKGLRILDMCAAPGGKTMQLADRGAQVTALDRSKHKINVLQNNLNRTNLTATCVQGDALHYRDEALFDVVVVDAPCSGSGTVRRHPDVAFVKTEADLPPLIEQQYRLLQRAIDMVRVGGRILYCVCSLLVDEGENQIARLCNQYTGLSVDDTAFVLPFISADWRTARGGVLLRPDYWADIGGMDGFYACILYKRC